MFLSQLSSPGVNGAQVQSQNQSNSKYVHTVYSTICLVRKMAHKQSTNNETSNGSTTEIIDETDARAQLESGRTTPTLLLRLEHPRNERRVAFHAGIIDNEHLNRKKSKCKH